MRGHVCFPPHLLATSDLHTCTCTCTDALDAAGIPHVRACAAMFAWVDLRAGLLEDSWEGEEELWRALCTDARVLFTPGALARPSCPVGKHVP